MPFIDGFALPESPAALNVSKDTFFISFVASNDPATGQSWCPDVRAALPHLQAAFAESDSPDAAIVQVGQRPECVVFTSPQPRVSRQHVKANHT
jgi:hypothetical protein